MKILHLFAEKQEAKLSLGWLDDNFVALVNKCNELEARIDELGQKNKENEAVMLAQADHILKLQTKKGKA